MTVSRLPQYLHSLFGPPSPSIAIYTAPVLSDGDVIEVHVRNWPKTDSHHLISLRETFGELTQALRQILNIYDKLTPEIYMRLA